MSNLTIDNLEITELPENILLIHQIKTPFHFSCCDGLLVLSKKNRNQKSIALDVNIEPRYVKFLNDKYGPFSDYVCTHSHMDHMAHIYGWEKLGVKIHAPIPEAKNLLDLNNFYTCFGFNEILDFKDVIEFGKINGYQNCQKVVEFKPGAVLTFENLEIETLPFPGHSRAHLGFLLPKEKIIHISCLGFDKPNPEKEGFGPWYGFRECSIPQNLKDIDYAESFFLNYAETLTSSHSYVVKLPDITPFKYMRQKIQSNHKRVCDAIDKLKISSEDEEIPIQPLLDMDLFFPKKKMKGFLLNIYALWEYWIIKKHLEWLELEK